MKGKGKDKDQDLFWYSSLSIPPPSNFIPGIRKKFLCVMTLCLTVDIGLIPVIKTALIESHKKGNTRRAALCFEDTVNVTKEAWDRTWGCGCVHSNMCLDCYLTVLEAIATLRWFARHLWPNKHNPRTLHFSTRQPRQVCVIYKVG
jgi:hypothetical protein